MQIITDRLIIRPFTPSDLPEFEKLLDIPEVPGWQMQKDNAAGFLQWHIANYAAMDIIRSIVCFGIFERETGCVLGAVGAGAHDDLHETEIFYNLLPSARGKGYAAEAARAITVWALANYPVPYLIATAEVDNLPSQKVLERCEYQFIEERALLVHITGETHHYKYYRFFR